MKTTEISVSKPTTRLKTSLKKPSRLPAASRNPIVNPFNQTLRISKKFRDSHNSYNLTSVSQNFSPETLRNMQCRCRDPPLTRCLRTMINMNNIYPAQYQPAPIPEMDGNPLIEALPLPMARKQFVAFSERMPRPPAAGTAMDKFSRQLQISMLHTYHAPLP